ncbi:LysR family transcriptional regulator [Streptomyces sp. XD-27]|uniref:LysR substrate-binding domain-containing protein n=1 Tax=Streptomyces sp. XD-27 TaxID=3062779 RepID=UPI0026F411C3|nr:LysR family transcriptional regulator [Streptomyces sp. XD-27]WKX72581.1 LysR family transcriptional regulator [Streptomyces sp. XD-27]
MAGADARGGGLEIRELECFLALSEELHFGRAAERLYVTQSRVSQLLRSLERRIGARLLDRTSRRVRLTPLGERFLAELRPAYGALRGAVDSARAAARGLGEPLRLGFQGTADEYVMAVVADFRDRHPGCEVETVEIPLGDPFGALRSGAVDAAIVLLPVAEPDLIPGPAFSRQPQTLAVSVRHPFAARASVSVEELADSRLIGPTAPAPRYWREAMAPTVTPDGRPIPRGPEVRTLQEGLSYVAADRGTMLCCAPTALHQGRRDVAFVPVTGAPESVLGLVWRRSHETERIRTFSRTLAEAVRPPRGAGTVPPGGRGARAGARV